MVTSNALDHRAAVVSGRRHRMEFENSHDATNWNESGQTPVVGIWHGLHGEREEKRETGIC